MVPRFPSCSRVNPAYDTHTCCSERQAQHIIVVGTYACCVCVLDLFTGELLSTVRTEVLRLCAVFCVLCGCLSPRHSWRELLSAFFSGGGACRERSRAPSLWITTPRVFCLGVMTIMSPKCRCQTLAVIHQCSGVWTWALQSLQVQSVGAARIASAGSLWGGSSAEVQMSPMRHTMEDCHVDLLWHAPHLLARWYSCVATLEPFWGGAPCRWLPYSAVP